MAHVVVFPSVQSPGWDGTSSPSRIYPVLPIREALSRRYPGDACISPYYVVNPQGGIEQQLPRLHLTSLHALDTMGASVLFDSVWIDIDDEDAHRDPLGKRASTQVWFDAVMSRLRTLSGFASMGWYRTLRGIRLVWELSGPLSPKEYLLRLEEVYDILTRHGLDRGGIDMDRFTDWTRVYFLPSITREGIEIDLPHDFSTLGVLHFGHAPRPRSAMNETPGSGSLLDGLGSVSLPLSVPEVIPAGERNKTLFKLGCSLRDKGLGEAALRGALRSLHDTLCADNPFEDPDEEIARIAKQASRYTPKNPLVHIEPVQVTADEVPRAIATSDEERADLEMLRLGSENELADVVVERLERRHGQVIFDRGSLWQYDATTGVWVPIPRSVTQLETMRFDGHDISMGLNAKGEEKFKPLKVGAVMTRNVADLVEVKRLHPGFFDSAAAGVTMRNAFVALADGIGILTAEPKPLQRSTYYLGVDYTPGQSPELLLGMLAACFLDDPDAAEKIQALREFIGICMLGAATRYQQGFILLGEGANGKSTLIEIVSALFDTNTITAIPPQQMDNEYRRAQLASSRLNVVLELPEASIISSESVKAVITGDRMNGRVIRQSPFDFKPRAGHLYAANQLPSVSDPTRGFWRRWRIIAFNREFAEAEQERGLAERIIREELPAVASWALDGAAEVAKRGTYTLAPSSDLQVETWQEDADQVLAFYRQRCVADVTAPPQTATDLYNVYCSWAEQTGHKAMTLNNFGRRFKRCGAKVERSPSGTIYYVRVLAHRGRLFSSEMHTGLRAVEA